VANERKVQNLKNHRDEGNKGEKLKIMESKLKQRCRKSKRKGR